MNKIVSISTAAKALGVSTSTLRRWEASGRLVPGRTEGGQRRYDLAALRPGFHHGAPARRQGWLSRFRGVASRYLLSYSGWQRLLDARRLTTPSQILRAIVGRVTPGSLPN